MPKSIAELSSRWLSRRQDSLTSAENRVLQSAIERRAIAHDSHAARSDARTRGERIADAIARVGGSWAFIISFLVFLFLWTVVGGYLLANRTFDPYPFIFLNLVLSMVAALQAPVIMMSQNRQAEHDRIDAAHDYEVNLKAEIEIMALHEKFDEMRHQEILLIRDHVKQLQEAMQRIELRLSDKSLPA